MADFKVRINSVGIQRMLAQLPAQLGQRVIRRGLEITTVGTEAAIKNQMSGRALKVRSGTYRRSVLISPAAMKNGRWRAAVSSNFVGANLLELGGTVKPTRRRVLTIPIPGGGALTPAGTKRFDAPTALRAGAFFVSAMASRTSGGFQQNRLVGGLIARTTGKGRRLIPLFALKGHATIRPHPIWAPVALKMQRFAVTTIESLLKQVITEINASGGRP